MNVVNKSVVGDGEFTALEVDRAVVLQRRGRTVGVYSNLESAKRTVRKLKASRKSAKTVDKG